VKDKTTPHFITKKGFYLLWSNKGTRGVEGEIFRSGFARGRGGYQQRKILITYHAHERHKAEAPQTVGLRLSDSRYPLEHIRMGDI